MSGTSAGWTKERRAVHSAFMVELNRNPEFIAKRRMGQGTWTEERRAATAAALSSRNSDPAFQARRLAGLAMRIRGVSLPKHCHPIVRGLFVEMNTQGATRARVAKPAGLTPHTITGWRKRHMPLLDAIDAALNTLDLELAIVPIGTRDQSGFVSKKTRNATTGGQR
jgi:hypothetical protein